MRKGTEHTQLWVALLWIVVSIFSLFIGVISYTSPNGTKTTYALQDLINGERFSKEVLYQYTGSFRLTIGAWVLTLLCALAAAAILSALIGILIMSKQKPVRSLCDDCYRICWNSNTLCCNSRCITDFGIRFSRQNYSGFLSDSHSDGGCALFGHCNKGAETY